MSVSRLQKYQIRWIWIFLAPTLLIIFLVAGYPLFQTIYLSFTDATLSNLDDTIFVGLDQYKKVLGDRLWWKAVWNTLVFTFFSVSIETVFGLMVALLLNYEFRARGLLRAAVLIPWAVPTVVSSQIWIWLYHDASFGFINGILSALGFLSEGESIAFAADPKVVFYAIIAVDIWKTTPFMALLLLAGLSTIPKSLYEASKIDGASPIQSFFRITLPLLKPTILVALIFRSLDALRVFDIIYVMQGSNDSTATISIYARQYMIDFQQIGTGSAASFAIFVLISIFTFLYVYLGKLDFNVER